MGAKKGSKAPKGRAVTSVATKGWRGVLAKLAGPIDFVGSVIASDDGDQGLKRAAARFRSQILRDQENVEAVVAAAAEHLAGDPPPDDFEPDPDFIHRFEKEAANASSSAMRDRFARLLSGEIRKPGSYSLATVQSLSVMDKKVADSIAELAPFFSPRYFSIGTKFLNRAPHFSHLARLQANGIISPQPQSTTMHASAEQNAFNGTVLTFPESKFILIKRRSSPIMFDSYSLTDVGRELVTLMDVPFSQLAFDDALSVLKQVDNIDSLSLLERKVGNISGALNSVEIWKNSKPG